MSRPTISVVVPMYNAGATVERSLRSLQSQDLTDWEAIVVDDGSSDDGAAIVQGMASDDPRIRLVRQDNRGVSEARNVATGLAQGEFLVWLDPDDLMRSGALAALLHGASETGAAVGHHDVVTTEGELLHPYRVLPRELGLHELLEGWSTRCGSHLVRRDLVGDTRWDPTLSLWEDRDYWLRLAERGVRWTRVDRVVTDYVLRPGGLSKRALDMMRAGERVLKALFARHEGEPGFSPETCQRLVGANALSCASRHAAIHADGAEASRALLEAIGTHAWEEHQLADAGWFGVLYGCGECPDSPDPDRPWWRGLEGVWEAIGVDEPARERVRASFAQMCVTPHRVALELLGRCRDAPGLVVIGCGRNGRALLELCDQAGVPTQARDDRATPEWASSAPMGDPIPHGWGVVVTPFSDEGLRARFPNAVFASDVRDELLRGAGLLHGAIRA